MELQKILVRFTSHHAPYVVGDVAGFPLHEVEALIGLSKVVKLSTDEIKALAKKAAAPLDTDIVSMRFDKPHAPYVIGDIAGFSRREAEELVLKGLGEIIKAADAKNNGPEPEPAVRDKKGGSAIAQPNPQLASIRFVKALHGYNVGDVAGFDDATALGYIERGEAVYGDGKESTVKASATTGDPDPAKVDENAEVHGLDDRDPTWREKAEEKKSAESAQKKGGK